MSERIDRAKAFWDRIDDDKLRLRHLVAFTDAEVRQREREIAIVLRQIFDDFNLDEGGDAVFKLIKVLEATDKPDA
jgi:hypothetical protein